MSEISSQVLWLWYSPTELPLNSTEWKYHTQQLWLQNFPLGVIICDVSHSGLSLPGAIFLQKAWVGIGIQISMGKEWRENDPWQRMITKFTVY